MNKNIQADKNDSKVVINDIDPETQEMLNKPIEDPEGFAEGEKEFIEEVMSKVYDGTFNLLSPSSLINEEVYEKASEKSQGQADINAVNFCSKLRQIKDLMDISGGNQLFVEPTFQVRNLVQSVKFQKEQFEEEYGDMFLI
jgi:hypothetical protein